MTKMNTPEQYIVQLKFDTARCSIRPFQEDDIDRFMAYRNDMDWMKYQGFKGLSTQAYREVLLCTGDIKKGVQLAVTDKQAKTLIGDLYLKQDNNVCWIGYTITPGKARQGYMYEVVSALISYMASQGIDEIKAGVASENIASISLLEKLGFTFAGTESGEKIFTRVLVKP